MAALVAQVRNASLARVGILSDDDLASFELYPVRNGVGTWRIELPNLVRNAFGSWVKHAMAAELAKPGAGIVVALPGGRRVSGPVVTPAYTETTDEPRGRWTFTGVTDTVILADRLAFPDPSIADAQASSASRAYDTRTGTAETLMHAYVSNNIGPASGTSRRDTRLTMGTDLGRGTTRPKSARFANLLELCQELAAPDNLNFEVVQVGAALEFRTSVPSDLSDAIRLDVANDTLDSASYAYSGPAATTVIVLGQGEAQDRTIVTRTAPATAWDRVIEAVVDARGSEEVDELNAKADEVIATNGGTITSLDVVPSIVNAQTIGTKWWLGDVVTINVAGVPVKATVSKVRLTLGPEGLYAGATVGDAVGFDPDRVTGSRVSSVESRVSSLERNGGGASERTALLPNTYLYRNAIGPTPVVIDGVLTDYALEWDVPYAPSGARSVRIRFVGDRWRITGQTYDAKDLHPLAGEYTMPLGTGWRAYGEMYNSSEWATGRAIVLPSGIVSLSGLLAKTGTPASQEVIARIPAAIAPDSDQYFAVAYGNDARGVIVKANGDIIVPGGNFPANTFVSLDRIAYPAKGVAQWTEVGAAGSGSSWGANFEDYNYQGLKAAYWKDPYGLVWFRGLAKVKVATSVDNTAVINLPATHKPPATKGEGHYRTVGVDVYAGLGTDTTTGIRWKTGTPGTVGNWISLAPVTVITSDANTLNNWWRLDYFANSWVNNGAQPDVGVTRREDGLVVWRGLAALGGYSVPMGRMPREAIPRETQLVTAMSNNTVGRVDMQGLDRFTTAGNIHMNFGTPGSWFSLDGINYAP